MTFPSEHRQCDRGHDLDLVGRDPFTGRCNACAAALRRLRAKHDRSPRPSTLDDQTAESIRVHKILELYDEKHRAATPWERNLIQQEIDRIK
mgnify:CR=1 FL=1